MSTQEAVEDVNNVLAELEAADAAKSAETTDGAAIKSEEGVKTEAADASGETQPAEKITEDAEVKTEVKTEANGSADNAERKHESDNRNGDRRRRDDDRRGRGRGDRGGRGRGSNMGRGRGGRKDYSENVRSNLISEEKSSDPVAIRKQVEFYFSDANLPMDKFLLREVNASENRPVPLDTIRSFKRMRHFEPTEAIVAALKESKLVQMVEDDTKVQRIEPLPKEYDDWVQGKVDSLDSIRIFEDKAMPRTVYVKGFGREVPSTQFDIEAFFAPYGPTNAIRLRRTDDKIFKSSVFVEFENEELAHKFVELDPKPKYQDRELKIMMKKEYCEQKKEDIEAGRIRPSEERPYNKRGRGGFRGNDRRRDGRDRGNDDRDWRTRREEDKKNGFRDRRGRDDRDHKPKSRDGEKDSNGIPVVKTEDARADAIAQAKAAVEAESKKDGTETKKREREEDAPEEPAAKKVDVKSETEVKTEA